MIETENRTGGCGVPRVSMNAQGSRAAGRRLLILVEDVDLADSGEIRAKPFDTIAI
jgi:hypothetical protein